MRDLRRVIQLSLKEGKRFIHYKVPKDQMSDGYWIASDQPSVTGFILDFEVVEGRVIPKNELARNCLQFQNL